MAGRIGALRDPDLVFYERMVEVSPGVALFTASPEGREKTLLVIHGGPDWDQCYLREPLPRLTGSHRVVLPDLRGCGWSTSGLADGQYTPDAVVNDLPSLIDELSAGKVALVGWAARQSADPQHVCRTRTHVQRSMRAV